MLERQIIQVVPGGHRVENVGFKHGVHDLRLPVHTLTSQDGNVIFQVLPNHPCLLAFKQRLKPLKQVSLADLLWCPLIVMGNRHISCLAHFAAKGHTHQLCVHVVNAGGFRV